MTKYLVLKQGQGQGVCVGEWFDLCLFINCGHLK